MKTHPSTEKKLTPPLYYALGAVVFTPLTALCLIMTGIILLLKWPLIPFLCCFKRKEQISKANSQDR